MAEISELFGSTLIVVAHPDDEAVGCGILLQRISAPIVVFLTDGAPRDEYFWGKYGSRLSYQRLREEEARRALARVGVSEVEFLGGELLRDAEGVADQELYLHLLETYERLAERLVRFRPSAVVTMAYEGGHPDHDCCGIIGARVHEDFKLPVWEFPLYNRAGSDELIRQQFIESTGQELELCGTSEETARKADMLQAYASQHPFILGFGVPSEHFRPQAAYDYSRPPHQGALNYEAWGWTVRGTDVCAAFREFASRDSVTTQ